MENYKGDKMNLKKFIAVDDSNYPLSGTYTVWEEVDDNQIFKEGELKLETNDVKSKIYSQIFYHDEWVLIRKENTK